MEAKGFQVHELTSSELEERFGVVGVPALAILSPEGSLAYSGGYTEQKQGLMARDLTLLAQARAGQRPKAMPILGCAVGAELRSALNPFNLP